MPNANGEEMDDGFPHGLDAVVASHHPTHDDPGDNLTTADLLRLLTPDDRVLWADRKRPLVVQERATKYEKRYTTGQREIAWLVEGPQGGEYVLGVWFHWGEDGDGLDDLEGVYTAANRVTDGAWDSGEHFYRVASTGRIVPIGSAEPSGILDDAATIIYTKPLADAHYVGAVTGTEFGEFVVEGWGAQPFSEAEHTVDPNDVLGYRRKA